MSSEDGLRENQKLVSCTCGLAGSRGRQQWWNPEQQTLGALSDQENMYEPSGVHRTLVEATELPSESQMVAQANAIYLEKERILPSKL